MSTWPRGYTHPVKEWAFCPLQQSQAAVATPAPARPRRPSSVAPHRKSSSQSTFRSGAASAPTRPASRRMALKFDKNRPLPPLPFLHSRKLSLLSRPLSPSASSVSSRTFAPPPIRVPSRSSGTTAKVEKLETTTPGLSDAQVITVQLEDVPYAYSALPSSVALPEGGLTDETSRRSGSLASAKEAYAKLDFSFLKDGKVAVPVPSLADDGDAQDKRLPGGVEEGRTLTRTPIKLQLEIPTAAASSDISPAKPDLIATPNLQGEPVPVRPSSRALPREEIVVTPGGYEERRYVYFPSSDETSTSASESKQSSPTSCDREPSSSLHPPPPPHHAQVLPLQPDGPCGSSHAKKASTSSSRSQQTFSTFGQAGGDRNCRLDTFQSQLTDYEDYEEDIDANYTCDSSSSSSSAASSSSVSLSAGTDDCATPVGRNPQRVHDGDIDSGSVRVVPGDGEGSAGGRGDIQLLPLPLLQPKFGLTVGDIALGLRISSSCLSDSITEHQQAMDEVRIPVPPTGTFPLVGTGAAFGDNNVVLDPEGAFEYTLGSLWSDSLDNTSDKAPKIARRSVSTSRLSVRFTQPPEGDLYRASSCHDLILETTLDGDRERADSASPVAIATCGSPINRASGSWMQLRSAAIGLMAARRQPVEEEEFRPATAPEAQSSRSFFEDDDDDDEEEEEEDDRRKMGFGRALTPFRRVKKFFVRCFTDAPPRRNERSLVAIGTAQKRLVVPPPAGSAARVDRQFWAIRKNFEHVQGALKRYRERGLEDMPVPPPAVVQIRVSGASSSGWRRFSSRLGIQI
ncbi:hypothetical protein DRE_00448 [Drechslerella stenobrocha 248]|uniref:Uncharacterized protein n=1 Tax=Drechslerella stenobrocha 248 TaxID=1043628 RepID=W7IER7_9PEZI|nr:hypothetical protein DRE_00448 [Drechslerella stenobrocha 248]